MSKKTYFCFQTFNQLLEDFTAARYNFYQALNLKHKKLDSRVQYIYTLDYTQHSLKYGILKSVFATLYNCLDKIANIIKFYFSNEEININKIEIYFDWLTKNFFKNLGALSLLTQHLLVNLARFFPVQRLSRPAI
jgi:hypothetical protein